MKKIILLILFVCVTCLWGCVMKKEKEVVVVPVSNIMFKKDNLYNGDAKFLNNQYVVTQIGGKLAFINPHGEIVKLHKEVNVNWCDVDRENRILVYGNLEKKIGICRFDEEFNILSNETIIEIQEDLGIDPSICKVDDKYYITVTHITGNINNADIQQENGNYSIRMYFSEDLKNWTEISKVIEAKQNLEDIDLNYYNDKFFLTYEKESYDKANSSINLLVSNDNGKSWEQNMVLIEENADNEPAVFEYFNHKFYLYYSSDIENLGTSYEGAKIYMQEYNENLQCIGNPIEIPLQNNIGNLLYDVEKKENDLYCLFTQKYITESNFILEKTVFPIYERG